jgi:DNA mismatch repair protein MutL
MSLSPPQRIKEIEDYQKIAAGEVIERPASVVKELLENSIDAGATKITINIQNYGKSLIQVIDDGCGIHPDDVKIAFLPHTSNKIRSAKELNTLHSLGFRGEALYSISSISKVELITKTKTESYGIKIELDGGNVLSIQQTAATLGTNIKVRDLFYNTPVRYKFLKSDRVELGHITDIVSRYVLGYPQINFKLVHNAKQVISSPSSSDYLNSIFDISGKDYAKNCVKFSINHALFSIFGYLGDPVLTQSTSHSSSLFINKRFVISPTFHEAMRQAFKDYIMINKHPYYVAFLTIDPSKVDFNIHPTKRIVRFEEEDVFLATLSEELRVIIKEIFGQANITGQLDQSVESSSKTIEEYVQNQSAKQPTANLPVNTQYSSPIHSQVKKNPASSTLAPQKTQSPKKTKKMPLEAYIPNLLPTPLTASTRDDWITTNSFPKMRLISQSGQMNKVYFMFEGEEGYYILDMHAADERINFEKELRAYNKGGMHRQRLIVPFTINVPINVKDFLIETISEIEKFGFEVEHLGGSTFTLRTIPTILKKVTNSQILTDICLEIIQIGRESSFTESRESIIKYIACHESIRGGDIITDSEVPRKLLKDLSHCENPHHCAHGRPTMLFFSWKYLEKEFHR